MRIQTLLGIGLLLPAFLAPVQSASKKWSFDADVEGKPPAGFSFARTGQGTEGQWVVKKDDSAPSRPHILAQASTDKTDYRFPLAVAEGTAYRDLVLSVRFKAISGSVDQGAGLVFRLKDKDNYYVVRANALEDNFRLYHVIGGRRVQFAGANVKVTPQAWHEIRIEARGDEFRCFFDGQLKITAKDPSFRDAGKVGLWTKADSVIYFDDLSVEDAGDTNRGALSSLSSSSKTLAQRLADDLAKRHPELVRIGLHVTPPGGSENIIIASNVAAKIGQKSDPEDVKAMTTGQSVVLKEGENFDVTLPLHAAGKTVGAIGLTLKPLKGDDKARAAQRARVLAEEIEKQIPSKESLFGP